MTVSSRRTLGRRGVEMKGIELAKLAARLVDEKQGEDIIVYDLHGMSDVADYFVLATVNSKSQARAIVGYLDKEFKELGLQRYGREGDRDSAWTLLDYSDTVIHIFSPELRAYYALENLWGDAPKVDWKS